MRAIFLNFQRPDFRAREELFTLIENIYPNSTTKMAKNRQNVSRGRLRLLGVRIRTADMLRVIFRRTNKVEIT